MCSSFHPCFQKLLLSTIAQSPKYATLFFQQATVMAASREDVRVINFRCYKILDLLDFLNARQSLEKSVQDCDDAYIDRMLRQKPLHTHEHHLPLLKSKLLFPHAYFSREQFEDEHYTCEFPSLKHILQCNVFKKGMDKDTQAAYQRSKLIFEEIAHRKPSALLQLYTRFDAFNLI